MILEARVKELVSSTSGLLEVTKIGRTVLPEPGKPSLLCIHQPKIRITKYYSSFGDLVMANLLKRQNITDDRLMLAIYSFAF